MLRSTKQSRTQTTSNGAFTLVELLVVIGIIAVLIGILLPALSRARAAANSVKCMANLRSIGQTMMIYVNENRGMLPYGAMLGGSVIKPAPGVSYTFSGESSDWTTLLLNLLNRRGSGYTTGQHLTGTSSPGMRTTFLCPQVSIEPGVESIMTHYSAHPRVFPDLATQENAVGFVASNTTLKGRKLGSIKRTAEIAAIFDATLFNPSGGNNQWIATACAFALDRARISYANSCALTDQYGKNTHPIDNGIQPNTPVDLHPTGVQKQYINQDGQNNMANLRFRHAGDTQANALMLDGHVQAFNYNKNTQTTDMTKKNLWVNP